MALTLVTAAAAPLVTPAEAKRHCRATDFDDDDAYLTALSEVVSDNIDGALGWVGRSIRQATWRLDLPCFPYWELMLPRPPLRSVTEVAYTDEDGASQTYATFRTFSAGATTEQGFILPAHDGEWPDTQDETPNAVRVTFEAGYDAVPTAVKHAALLMIGHLYEHREDASEMNINEMPFASKALLAPYRSWAVSS